MDHIKFFMMMGITYIFAFWRGTTFKKRVGMG